jgi:hypothetical protein
MDLYIEDEQTGQGYYLPHCWAICERCRGEGRHDHPAFANGITSSEWRDEWDPDAREAYMRGDYDVPCEVCDRTGKVRVPNVAAMTYPQKRLAAARRRAARWHLEFETERRAEERMGC